jgi:hypothetical protein
MSSRILIFFILNQISFSAWARLDIPNNLTAVDRAAVSKDFSRGLTNKWVENPYSLGGFSGYSVGVSLEQLETESFAKYGSGAAEQKTTSLAQIFFSKGLYYNFDFSLQWVPLGQSERTSGYGGAVKWGFFEMSEFPLFFNLRLAANTTNFQERISAVSQSLDLLSTLDFEKFSLSIGFGLTKTSTQFIGGVSGINIEGTTQSESLSAMHSIGLLTLKLNPVFLTASLDVGSKVVSSFAIGARF